MVPMSAPVRQEVGQEDLLDIHTLAGVVVEVVCWTYGALCRCHSGEGG